MKSKLHYIVLGLIALIVTVGLVTNPPGSARAGYSGSTPVAVGTATPVVVIQAGNKSLLTLCNTSAANTAYCQAGPAASIGVVSSTNWNIIVPAAVASAGNSYGGCWNSPLLQKPTQLGQGVAIPDQINCIGNGPITMQYYYR